MTTPLLTTKLYIPPLRPEMVSRPRQIEQLNAGRHRKLTLISAPAGFGKTTLVNDWLRSTDRAFAWLSLDPGDNNPIRFLNYLVAAFRQVDAKIWETAQRLLKAPQLPAIESLLAELINSISAQTASLVLVLDDYHTITEPGVHEIVSFLLERQPPQLHLVILSRQDPPLPLARLRGRGQITEIRQSDLRFTQEEAVIFLNQAMGLDLETSQVAALDTLTEGWIAGLQMAAVALQSRIADGGQDVIPQFIDNFSGRHHFIIDYLTDEVLSQQPEPIYQFLLRTCILERMCGPLCDAVVDWNVAIGGWKSNTPPPPSQQILEQLQQVNLFLIPLDDERQWYRYHRLFAELLLARLQEVAPDQIPELHRRAATWCDQNDLLAEAVQHALAIPDFDQAAEIIERAIFQVTSWTGINATIFMQWLQALPEHILRARHRLWLFASRVYYITGQQETAEQILQEIEEFFHDNPSTPDAENIRGLVAVDRASYAAVHGNVKQAIQFARQALAYLPGENVLAQVRVPSVLGLCHSRMGELSEASQAFTQAIAAARAAGLGFIAVPLVCNLVEVQIQQGRLGQAQQTCQQAREMAIVDGQRTSVAGLAELEWARILYEQNELMAAEHYTSEGLELLAESGTPDSFGLGHAILAQVKQAQGEADKAHTAIQQAIHITQDFDIARIATLIDAYQARIWLAQGKHAAVARWAQEYEQHPETEYLREFEDLTLVHVSLALEKPGAALEQLDRLLPPAEAAGRMRTVMEILALRALALQAQQELDAALETLNRALQLAIPEGYDRLFLDLGEPMARLLRQARQQGIAPDDISQLLASQAERRPAPESSPLVEPLSEREMQVLECLAGGLSNAEIAQQLFIALPTVKSHTRNIYGKLGVHNRKEAVAQAKALGII